LVDKKDSGKIRYKRINENTGKEVSTEDIAKAYVIKSDRIMPAIEIPAEPEEKKGRTDIQQVTILPEVQKGDKIILSDVDFEKAEPEKSRIIEVSHFVDQQEIETIFYENSYYIEPEKHGEKAYALLREALKKSGKVAVGQFVLRSTATLAVIKPVKEVLLLTRIRFAEEIRDTANLNLPGKAMIKPNEMKMALTLIDQYAEPFDIHKYKDEYAHSLLKAIQDRALGKETRVRKMEVKKTDDLVKQLKASLTRNRAS
jgi:DNA end-binding protein Ku